MWDPLGMLVITFIVMSVVSVIGLTLIYLLKNEKVKKGIFYFLCVWGMIITWCSVLATPEYMLGSIFITFGIGAMSVVALLLQICVKKENTFTITRILVTISVIAGMIDCFMI